MYVCIYVQQIVKKARSREKFLESQTIALKANILRTLPLMRRDIYSFSVVKNN